MSEDDRAWRPTPLLCPHCGASLDEHMHARPVPAVMKQGDYSLCLYCVQWAVYDMGGLRAPTPGEAREIATDNDCTKARFAVYMVKMQRGKVPKH